MNISRYLYVALASLLFLSCSSSLSDDDKLKLSSVAITGTSTVPKARQPVTGSKSPDAEGIVPRVTGGGLIPVLIGMTIDSAVVSSQKKNFEEQYPWQIKRLNTQVPVNLNRQLTKSTRKIFSADQFFGRRMSPTATNRVMVKVTNFGLRRTGRSNGHTLLNANIFCDVILTDRLGDEYISESIHAQSTNNLAVPILASNKSRTDTLFSEALRDYEAQLKRILDRQLKRK